MTKIKLSLLICALTGCLSALAQLSPDMDFSQHVDGKNLLDFTKSFPISNSKMQGVLPGGVRENSAWADTWAKWSVEYSDNIPFMRIDYTKFERGYCVFYIPFKPTDAAGVYEITMRARAGGHYNLIAGVRRQAAPYTWFIRKNHIALSSRWQDIKFKFKMPATKHRFGIYVMLQRPTIADFQYICIRKSKIEDLKENDKDIYAERDGNLIRHSNLPLGLQSGWFVDRLFSLGDDVQIVPDADKKSPGGNSSLHVRFNKKLMTAYDYRTEATFFSEPFFAPTVGKSYVASVQASGNGMLKMQVRADGKVIAQTDGTNVNTKSWQQINLPFKPAHAALKYVLVFTFKGDLNLSEFQVVEATKLSKKAMLGNACEVSLSMAGEDVKEARIVFTDEKTLIRWGINGKQENTELYLKLTDVWGREQVLKKISLVESQTEGAVNLAEEKPLPKGSFRLLAWTEKNGVRNSHYCEFVFLNIQRPKYWGKDAPQSVFGIHANPVNIQMEFAKAMGFNWVRLHGNGIQACGWFYIEREPGKWTFRDDLLKRYEKMNLSILASLSTTPEYKSYYRKSSATPPSHSTSITSSFFQPLDMKDFADYIRRIVNRYQGDIKDYDVWNEPWLPFFFAKNFKLTKPEPGEKYASFAEGYYITDDDAAKSYFEMQKTAYETVKSINPSLKVLGFNTTTGGKSEGRTPGPVFTEKLLNYGAMDYCDIICLHMYLVGSNGYPSSIMNREYDNVLGAVKRKYGKIPKPVWMTEGSPFLGSPLGSGMLKYTLTWNEEEEQWNQGSDIIIRYITNLLSLEKMDKIFIYSLGTYQGFDYIGDCAMQAMDGSVHPSGAAASALIYLLEDKKFSYLTRFEPNIYGYVFTGDNASVVVCLPAPDKTFKTWSLPKLKDVQLFDMYGNKLKNEKIDTPYPVYAVTGDIRTLKEILKPIKVQ